MQKLILYTLVFITGLSVGYYIAAAQAAEIVLANN